MTAQFQPGKTYETRSACDHDCIFKMKVIARSATGKSIRVLVRDEFKTLRVSEYNGVEQVKPFGSYSMAPIMSADKENA
jgi:hypothetical protein